MKEIAPENALVFRRYAWDALTHHHGHQLRYFRFHVGLSAGWLMVLTVLLRLETSPWLIVPLGVLLALLSFLACATHQALGARVQGAKRALQHLDAQEYPSSAKDPSPHALRLLEEDSPNGRFTSVVAAGFFGAYLLIALTSLYFSGLSVLRGKLPGWEAVKPVIAATPAPLAQDPRLAPGMPAYLNRPAGNYPPGATPFGGGLPRAGGNALPNGMPFRSPGLTPPPRPGAPPSAPRAFPGGPTGPFKPAAPASPVPAPVITTPPGGTGATPAPAAPAKPN